MIRDPSIEKQAARARRKARIRKSVTGTSERPRLSVFRSSNHIHAQIIDDARGHTLAAFSSLDKAHREALAALKPMDAAEKVGELLAGLALSRNIQAVVFDRNGYQFHGRVKALAEGARKGGLQF